MSNIPDLQQFQNLQQRVAANQQQLLSEQEMRIYQGLNSDEINIHRQVERAVQRCMDNMIANGVLAAETMPAALYPYVYQALEAELAKYSHLVFVRRSILANQAYMRDFATAHQLDLRNPAEFAAFTQTPTPRSVSPLASCTMA